LRETVVNAICHRDYASSVNVQIRIFDNRLEVWNPGELPEGMTIEDLRRQHESKPRNKLIGNAFFLIKYIEQFGTGIQRILDDCHAQRLPEPNLEAQGHAFRVVFAPGEFKGVKLNDRQTRAILLVRQRGHITRRQYERELDASARTANRDLKDLVEKGVLVPHGTGPQSKYILATDDSKDRGI
jgi:ATP-dependent DNA helicase RecG